MSCGKNILTPRFFFQQERSKISSRQQRRAKKLRSTNFFFRKPPPIISRSFLRAARYHDRYRGRDTRSRIRRFWKIKFIAFAARGATRCIIGCPPTKRRKYITSAGSPVVGADIIFMRARVSFARADEYGDAGGHVPDRQNRISSR